MTDLSGWPSLDEILDEEKDRREELVRLATWLGAAPDGDGVEDVVRALLLHPPAIRPLYRLLVDPDPVCGRMAMLSEIARRFRKTKG